MTQDLYRRIGAITGLLVGIAAMYLCGYWDVLPMAVFGAVGCVTGAMTAEKIYARNKNKEN